MPSTTSLQSRRRAYALSDIEKRIADAQRDGETLVSLPGGDYYLTQSLRLGTEHSGLQFASAPGERATLYGGAQITGWRQRDDGAWVAPAPRATNAERDCDTGLRMLLVNGRMAERARLPDDGYLLHDSPFDASWLSTFEGGWDRPPTDEELHTLHYRGGDLGAWLEPRDAEITVYHMWDESLVGIESIDTARRAVRFSTEPGYPPGAFADQYDMPRRYVVWNVAEGLTRAGQWRHDRVRDEIIYLPLPNESMENAHVVAPQLESIVVIDGGASGRPSDIELRDLTLAVTNAPLMTGAFGAKRFDGAISIRGADRVRLVGLEIHGVAAHAIKADAERMAVERCELHHTGASGIRSVGSHTRIADNRIHHVGLAFPSAIALYVGATDPNDTPEWQVYSDCSDNEILHNELHDTPYTAIAAGGARHRIEGNLIYRAMQNLYDGAGIYVTFCEEIVIRGNFVHSIKESAGAGTSAYYLDEKSKRCIVEDNLSSDVARPMHNHVASDNTIRSNVFVTPGQGRLTIERSSGFVFEKNIIVSPRGFALYDLAACQSFVGNYFVGPADALQTHRLEHYDIVETTPIPLGDENLAGDAGVTVSPEGVVAIDAGSPAGELGIEPIDVSHAGVRPAS